MDNISYYGLLSPFFHLDDEDEDDADDEKYDNRNNKNNKNEQHLMS